LSIIKGFREIPNLKIHHKRKQEIRNRTFNVKVVRMHQCTLTAYLRWTIVEATSIEYIEPLGDQTVFPFQVMFREEKFQNEDEDGKEILTHEPDLEM
jgi:hypothetical protein